MTTRSMLNALTNAILADNISVEQARQLIISASHDGEQELREAVELEPTAALAAKTLGISKATLYRRLSKAAAHG